MRGREIEYLKKNKGIIGGPSPRPCCCRVAQLSSPFSLIVFFFFFLFLFVFAAALMIIKLLLSLSLSLLIASRIDGVDVQWMSTYQVERKRNFCWNLSCRSLMKLMCEEDLWETTWIIVTPKEGVLSPFCDKKKEEGGLVVHRLRSLAMDGRQLNLHSFFFLSFFLSLLFIFNDY